ncbi:SEC-C metal-binding domain-containing protein [Texcoconibacillus texcoconensis]|uniref:SEC-C motif-containing protein n=1 Tax=Texcoconibacillus texcoconensis TaxID=1095777 RepID=A0A840QM28_9BACI|nr:hypothetical protein [Texcoconibacillus texcoconensis]
MVNKKLQENIFNAVDEQLSNGNPIEVGETYNRLQREGYSKLEAKKMIGSCLLTGIANVMQGKEVFDNDAYIAKLKKLPDYYYELMEDTDEDESDVLYENDDIYVNDDEFLADKVRQEPVRSEKIGRNEPCLCGSGKKYKKCCGA